MKKPVKPKVKPSKRPKKRYVLFEVKADRRTALLDVKRFMVSCLKDFFGNGFTEKGIWVTSFFEEKSLGIVRCNRDAVNEVKKGINSFRFKSRVLLVSGTIKTLKEKIKRTRSAK